MRYSRKKLIEITEKAFVPMSKWDDRDSPEVQKQVILCGFYLRIGCDFKILTEKNSERLITDGRTIWLEIKLPPTFVSIENCVPYDQLTRTEDFYLPTEKRLKECKRDEWY